MVDVVIPRETGNVLSLPSSYNTDPGMQPQVAIPVEFGAALGRYLCYIRQWLVDRDINM